MTGMEMGQVAYEAYCNKADWKSLVTGAPLPQFKELPEPIQEAWKAGAIAVAKAVTTVIADSVRNTVESC